MRAGQKYITITLFIITSLGYAACQKGEEKRDQVIFHRNTIAPPPPPKTEKSAAKSGAVQALTEEEEQRLKESEGTRCNVDQECALYLRCYDATCQIPPAINGIARQDTPRITFRKGSEQHGSYFVELAVNQAQTTRGLMFRRKMKPNWGMLFVFPEEAHRTFWMKNTFIPLDMVFIGADGTVRGVVENATPHTLQRREVEGNSRYVLELSAGEAAKHKIERGDIMSTENLPDEFKPVKSNR